MTQNHNQSVTKARTLLGLQLLSDFGDQITIALLAVCLLDITQSTGKVGFVSFITVAGYAIFTFVGGYLGDRISRRNILFFSDMGRGLVVLLLILAIQERSIILIYATSFLLSILSSVHGPVKVSIWAENIPQKQLGRYNSLSEMSTQLSTVTGPLIASFFVAREWIGLGFAIDAMTFFICAIIFTKVIARKSPVRTIQSEKNDFLRGFKLIKQHPQLYRFISYDALQMMGFGAFNATFFVLAQRDFGWSKINYSFHLSLVAVFTAFGAFLGATSWVANIKANTKLLGCAIISAITIMATIKIQTFPIGSFLIGISNILVVLTISITKTKVQLFSRQFYPQYLSSILASRSIIIKAATLLGIGGCLLMDDFISLESTLILFMIPVATSIVPLFIGEVKEAVSTRDDFTDSFEI